MARRPFTGRVFGRPPALVSRLPEPAVARGAKPHWLGHLGVADPEVAAAAFERRGATRLGPRTTGGGGSVIALRDPGGAVVGIGADAPAEDASGLSVRLHALNTHDPAAAQANYTELFGWSMRATFSLGALGSWVSFAWSEEGPTVGVIADVAGRPGVHPQWLFFFEVHDLDATLASARDQGALVLDPIALPDGTRLCACDDPQGGAFGVMEQGPRA